MKPGKLMLFLLVGLFQFSVCSAWLNAQENDPVIDSKPASQWIKQLQSENRGQQIRAAQTLAKAPAETQPALAMKIMPLLKSERENDKFVAAQTLGEYGAVAKQAVPDLLPMLEGTQYERNRAAAAKALGQILKDSPASGEVENIVKALMMRFDDKYSDVRKEAVNACGMIGPAAKACLPLLPDRMRDNILGFKNEGYGVRVAAAWTCGRMGSKDAAVHLDLLISLLHSDSRVNVAIVETIGIIGPVNEGVVMHIVDVCEELKESSHDFSIAAMQSLAKFGPKAAPAVPYLLTRVRAPLPGPWLPGNIAIRTEILRTLRAIGPAAADAGPVAAKLADPNGPARDEAYAELRKEAALTAKALEKQASPDPGTPEKGGAGTADGDKKR